LVEGAALAVPPAPRRSGAGQRPGRRPDTQARRNPQREAAWFPTLARRDFQIGANLTAGVVDDPDAYFFENYKCGSPRNYTDYCDEQVDRMIDAQSQELDRAKRVKLVWQIQRKLEADVARPMLGWRKEYFTQWPYVKNLVPHNALYNYGRMQDVWLDK
jgi:peptide/nickel transport system substrate-binding protein